jgi:hypothetical protein
MEREHSGASRERVDRPSANRPERLVFSSRERSARLERTVGMLCVLIPGLALSTSTQLVMDATHRSAKEIEAAHQRREEERAALQALRAAEEARLRLEAERAEEERLEAARRAEEERVAKEMWGSSFEDWLERPANAATSKTIKLLLSRDAHLRETRAELKQERESNDAAVVPPSAFHRAIFNEASGYFTFLKILDRAEAEALFSASDGLFVLRLSPGDSLNAFPGQNVQMTMHSRGERMRMTDGRRLPVFLSGPSPTRLIRTKGTQPDRRGERRLAAKAAALQKGLRRTLSTLGARVEPSVFRLKRSADGFEVRIRVNEEHLITSVQILNSEGYRGHCMAVEEGQCPASEADGAADPSQHAPIERLPPRTDTDAVVFVPEGFDDEE